MSLKENLKPLSSSVPLHSTVLKKRKTKTVKSKWKVEEEKRKKKETMLDESKIQYSLFPIPKNRLPIWEMYKKAQASFWTFEEIDLQSDKVDWPKLTKNEQYFIKKVLSFFAVSDGIVNENLLDNFASETQWQTIRAFYGFQIAIENIHNETYSQLIETFVDNKEEKLQLFDAIENDNSIAKKAKWCFKYANPDNASFAERLIAFAAVEGIFFSASFASIFWLKKRGLMPGLTFSNELISRDDGLHCDFACLLYNNYLDYKLPEDVVQKIIKDAVEIECEFVKSSLPVNLIGMNSDMMQQYVRFVADRLLVALNCKKVYEVVNPFSWMEMISLQGKTNFFEKRVSDYSLANVGSSSEERQFQLDMDF